MSRTYLVFAIDPALHATGYAWQVIQGRVAVGDSGAADVYSGAVDKLGELLDQQGVAKAFVFIERSRAPFRRYASAAGVASAVAQLIRKRHPRRTKITMVEPAHWMEGLTKNMPGATTKERTRNYLVQVLKYNKGRVERMSDDESDAVALCEYGRIMLRREKVLP